MGSVIFDFDSTLVPCETLEVLCAAAPGIDDAARREIERLTAAGMDGRLSFGESLRARLALARVDRARMQALGASLAPSAGAAALVAALEEAGHEVSIVSGGFKELIDLVAPTLGVPETRVHAVRVRWRTDGSFGGLREDDGFSRSKLEGLASGGITFARPAVVVGDGATDLALCEAGLVDHFVAYTEHVRRDAVVRRARHEAASMEALGRVLEALLA